MNKTIKTLAIFCTLILIASSTKCMDELNRLKGIYAKAPAGAAKNKLQVQIQALEKKLAAQGGGEQSEQERRDREQERREREQERRERENIERKEKESFETERHRGGEARDNAAKIADLTEEVEKLLTQIAQSADNSLKRRLSDAINQ